MKRTSNIAICTLLVLSMGLVGCLFGGDDATTTCGNYDDFLGQCTTGCRPTWDCASQYDTLHPDDQIALDDCSDCLVANVADGVCDDCSVPGIGSCHAFMEDFLSINCW